MLKSKYSASFGGGGNPVRLVIEGFWRGWIYKRNSKLGFTLAEVLITLGVIGVISAITLPNLIAKYNEKIWLYKFKQTYSILSQATISVLEDFGHPDGWELHANDTASADKMYEMYSQYLKVSYDGGSGGAACRSPVFKTNEIKNLNGNPDLLGLHNNGAKYHCFTLLNGASIGIAADNIYDDIDSSIRMYGFFLVDVNGTTRPNTIGKDIFYLYLQQNNAVDSLPTLNGYKLWWVNQMSCSRTSKQAWTPGAACSIWVIKNWNMDYLHKEITSSEWKN